jgi:hypothetical protein
MAAGDVPSLKCERRLKNGRIRGFFDTAPDGTTEGDRQIHVSEEIPLAFAALLS